jgi:hypothetical protein
MAILDPTLRTLDDCGCGGLAAETPGVVQNRPGLAAIAYRSGTWREFKASLLASLSAGEHVPLARLTTRGDDDFTIALLDAFATAADVLTFYQERIANEGYLRTATERRSILELARLIGYELGPGVAAETLLAFTVDDAPGAPGRVAIDVGVRVQSVPGQDEKPQTFETVEPIDARADWNAMRPRALQAQALPQNATALHLAGVATGLKAGDGLLLVSPQRAAGDEDGAWDFVRLTRVQTDDGSQTTRVEWETGLEHAYSLATPETAPAVYALRTRAALFGHNAPDPKLLPDPTITRFVNAGTIDDAVDPHWKFSAFTSPTIELDAAYPAIRAGSWTVLAMPFLFGPLVDLFQVTQAQEGGEENFGLSGKITLLKLDRQGYLFWFGIGRRGTTVFSQGERLTLAERPAPPTVGAGTETILLDRAVSALPAGRRLLISGIETATGAAVTEEATVDSVAAVTLSHLDPPITVSQLTLVAGLQHTYRRDSVAILGNVAAATQGETVAEVLGAGDASKSYQSFTLRQPPLTFTRNDSSPTGAAATLEVRVNDLRWDTAPFFYGHGPAERIYTARLDDDGNSVVQFGDGIHGARLPSGQENVRATYRKGVGMAGNVKAGQLTTLLTRPLGLKGVLNPLPAVGGDDPEQRDAARDNAPLQVRTLDRVVSLLDYEDFARAYSGIAKALATWSWDGQVRGVFLTVAGPAGAPVTDDVLAKLESAIRTAGDPFVPLRLKSYRAATFRVRFKIKVDAASDKPAVLAGAVDRLRERFSFAARAFGQAVALAEVIATVQAAPGIVAVDVDRLIRTDGVGGSGLVRPLPAAVPQPGSLVGADAAELLTLSDAPIHPGDMP